jgi:hypothetical protein
MGVTVFAVTTVRWLSRAYFAWVSTNKTHLSAKFQPIKQISNNSCYFKYTSKVQRKTQRKCAICTHKERHWTALKNGATQNSCPRHMFIDTTAEDLHA